MNAYELVKAYADYDAECDAYEAAHPSDLLTVMDRPAPPVQSIAAIAGQMITDSEYGLKGALARALAHALDGTEITAHYRAVYTELVIAAVS